MGFCAFVCLLVQLEFGQHLSSCLALLHFFFAVVALLALQGFGLPYAESKRTFLPDDVDPEEAGRLCIDFSDLKIHITYVLCFFCPCGVTSVALQVYFIIWHHILCELAICAFCRVCFCGVVIWCCFLPPLPQLEKKTNL